MGHVRALVADMLALRGSVDDMLRCRAKTPRGWMRQFMKLLAACAQIYLDAAKLKLAEPVLSRLATGADVGHRVRVSVNARHDERLRMRIETRLKHFVPWVAFSPENEFSRWTNLWERRDYIFNISFSLSEIYGQTRPAEAAAMGFLSDRDPQALADILVRTEVMAMHHLGVAMTALQWASDDGSWMDLRAAQEKQKELEQFARKRGATARQAARGADAYAATRRARA
jgi:hypothetical protein